MSNQLNGRVINPTKKTRPTTVTTDAAYTVKAQDSYILLNSTAATKVLTLPTVNFVTTINIRMVSNTGGDYTAAVTGGVLTFNATGEAATIISNPINNTWQAISLNGATVV